MTAPHEDDSVPLFPYFRAWTSVYFVFKYTVAVIFFSKNGPKTTEAYILLMYTEQEAPWNFCHLLFFPDSPDSSVDKESACNAGLSIQGFLINSDPDSIRKKVDKNHKMIVLHCS